MICLHLRSRKNSDLAHNTERYSRSSNKPKLSPILEKIKAQDFELDSFDDLHTTQLDSNIFEKNFPSKKTVAELKEDLERSAHDFDEIEFQLIEKDPLNTSKFDSKIPKIKSVSDPIKLERQLIFKSANPLSKWLKNLE